ncbi:LSU ribosomal protein L24p (L26e) [Olavius algarvensis spirochete endosymbiont]|uniref:50S ribosomal protein L24 n=1 Tax=Olavius algarvensis spirochete endosymbiont TaxID=260710 RepID=UPI000F0EF5FA|nr:50S ribosomal protein L24 [Olavius algarvensis spirochete endosymbiont]VDB01101.1 LSU ribosomal protein L24p (L26e) [Olavius algarvensis spirochete endosymbiont]
MKTKLKKGDQIQIIAGKDKGKQGRILKIDRMSARLIAEGLNIVKKTQRPKSQNDKGGIIELEAPITASNVMLLCRKCGPTRIAMKLDANKKSRICRKCGETL